MEGGSVLGLEEVGLQCRVKVMELGGLEWEVEVSSELGEPELGLGSVSRCGETSVNTELLESELR